MAAPIAMPCTSAPRAGEPALGLWEGLRRTRLFCLGDPANPLEARIPPTGGLLASIRRSALTLPGCIAEVVFLTVLCVLARSILPSLSPQHEHWLAVVTMDSLGFLLLASIVTPALTVRRTLDRARRSGFLESLLLTRLTNEEIMRGLVVPDMRRHRPLLVLSAAVGLAMPALLSRMDATRVLMTISIAVSATVNLFVVSWIAFALLADRRIARWAWAASLAVALVDPYALMWGAGLIHSGWRWRPLVFAFVGVEIVFCILKITFARLAIDEMRHSLRDRLTAD